MIVDTGCRWHVIGFEAAGIAPVATTYENVVGTDYAGRIVAAIPASTTANLPGWPPLDELLISSWADPHRRGRFAGPNEPQTDGVISPIRLAAPGRVVVIDFTTSTLSIGSWADAEARLAAADVALTPSPVAIGVERTLILPVVVGERTLSMMLDTGAPTSWLFVPRGGDLREGLARISQRVVNARVGALRTPVQLSIMERLGAVLPYEGLLGMDVLRSCVLALDGERFVARCLSNRSGTEPASTAPPRDPPPATLSDLNAWRDSRRRRQQTVQLGSNELEMRQRADGGYEWTGQHVTGQIRGDGRLSFSKVASQCRMIRVEPDDRYIFGKNGRVTFDNEAEYEADCPVNHTQMDAEDERRWFEAEVGDLLVTLARAREREVILDALEELPRRLSAILADRRLSLAQRRRILFLLWDEMAEPDDAERGWAGARARRLIDLFVREHLPPGTPGAYSAAELAAFNRARQDGVRFDPYQAPVRDTGDDH